MIYIQLLQNNKLDFKKHKINIRYGCLRQPISNGMKTRKSITKRFKITKNGKVMRRAVGQDHLRSKKSGDFKRKKRKWVAVTGPLAKQIKKLAR